MAMLKVCSTPMTSVVVLSLDISRPTLSFHIFHLHFGEMLKWKCFKILMDDRWNKRPNKLEWPQWVNSWNFKPQRGGRTNLKEFQPTFGTVKFWTKYEVLPSEEWMQFGRFMATSAETMNPFRHFVVLLAWGGRPIARSLNLHRAPTNRKRIQYFRKVIS
jgi:hypothetical protein